MFSFTSGYFVLQPNFPFCAQFACGQQFARSAIVVAFWCPSLYVRAAALLLMVRVVPEDHGVAYVAVEKTQLHSQHLVATVRVQDAI